MVQRVNQLMPTFFCITRLLLCLYAKITIVLFCLLKDLEVWNPHEVLSFLIYKPLSDHHSQKPSAGSNSQHAGRELRDTTQRRLGVCCKCQTALEMSVLYTIPKTTDRIIPTDVRLGHGETHGYRYLFPLS